jgi:hypothetical protein
MISVQGTNMQVLSHLLDTYASVIQHINYIKSSKFLCARLIELKSVIMVTDKI